MDAQRERRRQYEAAMNPEVVRWMELHQLRAVMLTEDELDELFSLAGTGGPLTREGVEHFVQQIERRRELVAILCVLWGSHLGTEVEEFLRAKFAEIQPYLRDPD